MSKQFYIRFQSSVPEIAALRIYSMPRQKPLDIRRIAKHGAVEVYQDPAGKLYSRRVTFNGTYPLGRGVPDDYIRIAAKFGIITNTQARQHFKEATANGDMDRHRRRVSEFKWMARNLGIELTSHQISKLKS